MKFILLILIAVLTFALALVASLAATGNLSKEAIDKLLSGKKEEAPVEAKAEPLDDVDPIARALKERDDQLKQREAKVTEDEQRLKIEQQDIEGLRNELQQALQQIAERVNATEQGDEEALTKLSKTLSAMRPKNAADAITGLSPEKAARVLRLMKEKDSGKILDSMSIEQRALVMRSLTQPAPPAASGESASPSASAAAPPAAASTAAPSPAPSAPAVPSAR